MVPAFADLERFLHERDMRLLVQLALAHYQFEVIWSGDRPPTGRIYEAPHIGPSA